MLTCRDTCDSRIPFQLNAVGRSTVSCYTVVRPVLDIHIVSSDSGIWYGGSQCHVSDARYYTYNRTKNQPFE